MSLRGKELVQDLCMTFGPSGCEDKVAQKIRELVLPYADEVTTDRLGSLLVLVKGTDGENSKRLMLAAHMDEVGFMIRSVGDNGLLYPARLSIGEGKMLTSRSVSVGNAERQIDGVVGAVPAHRSSGGADFDSLYIDIGAKNRAEAERYVQKGDYGVFRTEFEVLGETEPMWKGKAIDDRLGCAVLIEVLANLAESGARPRQDTWFCFTRREEVGASTATTAAWTVEPDVAIVLEATAVSDVHGTDERWQVGKQGNGPLVSLIDAGTIYDKALAEALLTLGEVNRIPVQIKQYPGGTNDTRPISKVKTGVRVAAISAPTRYIHSAACAVRQKDYEAMVALVEKAVLTGVGMTK